MHFCPEREFIVRVANRLLDNSKPPMESGRAVTTP